MGCFILCVELLLFRGSDSDSEHEWKLLSVLGTCSYCITISITFAES